MDSNVVRWSACPRCGGTTGFEFVVRVFLQGSWGSEAETTGDSDGPQKVRCLDCGRMVDRKNAEGRAE